MAQHLKRWESVGLGAMTKGGAARLGSGRSANVAKGCDTDFALGAHPSPTPITTTQGRAKALPFLMRRVSPPLGMG